MHVQCSLLYQTVTHIQILLGLELLSQAQAKKPYNS